MLVALTEAQLEQTIAILGAADSDEPQREAQTLALLGDTMLARRAIDWITEAFGLVQLSQMGKIGLPEHFSARDRAGRWVKFPITLEPVYAQASQHAQHLHQVGSRDALVAIAQRSGVFVAASKALAAGHSLDGANFSSLAMIGIPAEVYAGAPESWWRKLFG